MLRRGMERILERTAPPYRSVSPVRNAACARLASSRESVESPYDATTDHCSPSLRRMAHPFAPSARAIAAQSRSIASRGLTAVAACCVKCNRTEASARPASASRTWRRRSESIEAPTAATARNSSSATTDDTPCTVKVCTGATKKKFTSRSAAIAETTPTI